MKVFLIGGTGYLGRSVAGALADAGHQPSALARSPESRAKVVDPRVRLVDGTVDDLDVLVRHAAEADAVVYLAVPGLVGARSSDSKAIEAILHGYASSGKTFILTSGLAVYLGLRTPFVTSETSTAGADPGQSWRTELEQRVLIAADSGVRAMVIRPSIVYGRGTASALLLALLSHAAAGGAPFYIGDGANRIPTVHVDDLARLYVAALAKGTAGTGYNAASGSVLGYDLAHAVRLAVGSPRSPISLDIPQARRAVGPAGPTLAMDLKVSEWEVTAKLAWVAREPSVLHELSDRRIAVPVTR